MSSSAEAALESAGKRWKEPGAALESAETAEAPLEIAGKVAEAPAYQMIPILPVAVNDVWARAKPLVERALDQGRGEATAEDVRDMLRAGDCQLWMIVGQAGLAGIIVSEIKLYPQQKVALFWLVAGEDLAGWKALAVETINGWAAEHGCDEMEGYGRRGFGPVLKDLGWKQAYTVYRREVRP